MGYDERPDAVERGPAMHPRIEITRTSSGGYSWKVSMYALDNTPEAIAAARQQAETTEAELFHRFGHQP